jgi:hypothetical protein
MFNRKLIQKLTLKHSKVGCSNSHFSPITFPTTQNLFSCLSISESASNVKYCQTSFAHFLYEQGLRSLPDKQHPAACRLGKKRDMSRGFHPFKGRVSKHFGDTVCYLVVYVLPIHSVVWNVMSDSVMGIVLSNLRRRLTWRSAQQLAPDDAYLSCKYLYSLPRYCEDQKADNSRLRCAMYVNMWPRLCVVSKFALMTPQ